MEESEERKNKPSGKHLFTIQSGSHSNSLPFYFLIRFYSLPFILILIRFLGNHPMVLNRNADSAFKQQKLPAWQPILTAGTVLPTFALIGIAFIPIGFGLLMSSNQVCTFLTVLVRYVNIHDCVYVLYILYVYIVDILYIWCVCIIYIVCMYCM